MPLEIERKFLVTGTAWRHAAHTVIPMAQGYLNDLATVDSGAMRTSVRVRIAGEEAFLNLKSRELGHTRQEFDYPIPKRRHLVEHAGHTWEVDEFLGENAGLVVAEIELDSAGEAFERPGWIGVEVTDRPRYYNLALASRPYSQWSEAERAAIDVKE